MNILKSYQLHSPFNFDPIFSRTIGFDNIFDRLNRIAEENIQTSSYPPYNIIRHDDNKFDIEIAVAGFKEEELNVEYKDNTITVEGTKEEKQQDEGYAHRGIASRSFRRVWHLEDYTEAVEAELKDGLLKIHLEKVIPEEMRAKKIHINLKAQASRSGMTRSGPTKAEAELLNESVSKKRNLDSRDVYK